MTVSSNTNNNVGTTDRDAELARSLQEQFRHEAEAAGLTSSFFRSAVGRSATSGTGTSNNEQRASLVAAVASGGTRRSNSNSGSSSGGDGHNQSTPKYKQSSSNTSNNNSTPDTTASTPSPDHRGRLTLLEEQHQHQQLELGEQERKKRSTPRSSTRSSPRGSPRSSPRTSPRGSPRSSPRSSPRNSFSLANFFIPAASSDMNDTSNDEKIARRLEQELRDAELASQLTQQERASGDFGVVANTTNTRSGSSAMGPVVVGGTSLRPDGGFGTDGFEQNNALPLQQQRRSHQSQNSDCRGKALYYSTRIFLSLLIAAITFIVFITMFGGSSGTPDVLDPSTWMPGYPELDPSLGSVGEHNKWKPPNGQNDWSDGLQLTVLNNLKSGSGWSDYLKTSLSEWNNGSPDAVTLNMREMSNDPDCRAVRRAMKVCNGNYGPTDWRGVNQILLQDEYIITSLAKMNDYYLDGTNRAQKQYTMCHELGHGLGLGHSDENFNNKDLGNCMDYTNRPQNNMSPDTSNFEMLQELYGSVMGGNLRVSRSAVPDDRRVLNEEEQATEDEFQKYAAYLMDPVDVTSKSLNTEDGWRLLRKTEYVEHHERRLGNGYTIHTSVLLA